jgi:hypothetical protein
MAMAMGIIVTMVMRTTTVVNGDDMMENNDPSHIS